MTELCEILFRPMGFLLLFVHKNIFFITSSTVLKMLMTFPLKEWWHRILNTSSESATPPIKITDFTQESAYASFRDSRALRTICVPKLNPTKAISWYLNLRIISSASSCPSLQAMSNFF